jgi:hypothetical protein
MQEIFIGPKNVPDKLAERNRANTLCSVHSQFEECWTDFDEILYWKSYTDLSKRLKFHENQGNRALKVVFHELKNHRQ